MKSFSFFMLLSVLTIKVSAQQDFNADSVKQVWKASYKRILKKKALVDTLHVAFAFDKATHQLMVATLYAYPRKNVSILNDTHFYFLNDRLLWFKVFIQYPPNRKEKGYVEYFYADGQLVKKIERGKVVSDYSFLHDEAMTILDRSHDLIGAK